MQSDKKKYLFGKTPALKYTPLKKKKNVGGFLQENSQGIGAAGNLLGSTVNSLAPEGSMGGGIASGALQGAGSLAALGPWGMAAGAVIGGTMGAINAKKAKETQLDTTRQKEFLINKNFMNNAGNTYMHGGQMLAKSLNVKDGGNLTPVSDDAVEVKADNPNESDSVELDSAFVDNGEVIDREARVFSNELTLPNGKTIAKEAKRLEKMKAEDYEPRFAASNKRIDSKLDDLFNYQESMKKETQVPGLKHGGKTKISFKKGGKLVEFFAKPKKAQGGPVDPWLDSGLPMEETKIQPSIIDMESKPKLNQETSSVDWNKGLTQAATFIPNMVSGVLQKRLKPSPTPLLESRAKLARINPNAQLAANTRAATQAQEVIKRGSAQASDLISGTGSLLAKKLAADNQVYGQTNQINASIQGQEAAINQGVGARNIERTNQFRDSIAALDNKKLQLTSENVANLSQKILTQGRERNEIDRDKFAMEVIGKRYEDSGVFQRQIDEMWQAYQKSKGLKKGGKLKLNIKKAGK